jgi:hypothetical protein
MELKQLHTYSSFSRQLVMQALIDAELLILLFLLFLLEAEEKVIVHHIARVRSVRLQVDITGL